MNKFLLKVVIPFCFIGVVYFSLYFFVFPHPASIAYAKHDLLVQTSSPKIVYTGGSNALFGIDSELIENNLKTPVINFSIQAGVPISFYIREISPHIGKGDTVLLVLEYGYYYGIVRNEAIAALVETYPIGIPSFLPEYWQQTPQILKLVFRNEYTRVKDTSIVPREYNKWGDAVYMLDYKGGTVVDAENGTIADISAIDPKVIQQINDFSREAKAKGANVVIFFPSLSKSQFDPQRENARKLYDYLISHLDCTILGTPEEYAFPDKYITNTSYHLDGEGRRIRTEMMIAELQKSGLIRP
jgi:hypothetical protein